mmetsp:Transcript_114995/g.264120  ORF Transcript_114995/g.264120 Transcript_114995/m.264120 type:complete len:96 (+) Transcript_114995:2102-2389(+)
MTKAPKGARVGRAEKVGVGTVEVGTAASAVRVAVVGQALTVAEWPACMAGTARTAAAHQATGDQSAMGARLPQAPVVMPSARGTLLPADLWAPAV